jgi:hypothetical protein
VTRRAPRGGKPAGRKTGQKRPPAKGRRGGKQAPAPTTRLADLGAADVEALRKEILERTGGLPPRWNADPDDVQRSVVKLVLTLVEFLRALMERQALRRMDERTLSPEETERVGLALMRLEETIRDLAARFEIPLSELNLDLGPLGQLK